MAEYDALQRGEPDRADPSLDQLTALDSPASAKPQLRLYGIGQGAERAAKLSTLFAGFGIAVMPWQPTATGTPDKAELPLVAVIDAAAGDSANHVSQILSATQQGDRPVLVVPDTLTLPASITRRCRLVRDSGDLYLLFEEVAAAIGLIIHPDAFLSYARVDRAQASRLASLMLERGRRIWMDLSGIQPSEDWKQALRRAVDASDSFIYLLSPASVASLYCREEVEWAEAGGKRIIPVVIEAVDPAAVPEKVRARQWINVSANAPEKAAEMIVAALARDPEHVAMHRHLLQRASDWDRGGRDASLLIRGTELADAERWLRAAAAADEPRPTQLHLGFLEASRRARQRWRRNLAVIISIVGLALAGLTVAAVLYAVEANRQADGARARLAEQRAFESFIDWDTDAAAAFGNAFEATQTAPQSAPERTTYGAMAWSLFPQQAQEVRNLEVGVSEAAISDDGHTIALAKSDGPEVVTLEAAGRRDVPLVMPAPFLRYRQFTISPDNRLVAAIFRPFFDNDQERPDDLIVWDAADGKLIGQFSIGFGRQQRASIVGFLASGTALLIEARDPNGGMVGRVLQVARLDAGPIGSVWRSPVRFTLGRVDLASGLAVAVERPDRERRDVVIRILRLMDGTPAPGWPELRFPGTIDQVFLAKGGGALAVVGRRADGSFTTRVWRRNGTTAIAAGAAIESPERPFIWDLTADGATAAVIVADAGYPAEIWSFEDARRGSLPVSSRITSPFIMDSGEEYRVLDFIDHDKSVLVREPEQGLDRQKLWVFDRKTLALVSGPYWLRIDYAAARPIGDGTRFVRVGRDGAVETRSVLSATQPVARRLPIEDLVLQARFFNDGKRLVTISRIRRADLYRARVDVWDISTGRHLGRLPSEFPARVELALRADGSMLAIAGIDGDTSTSTVELWRVADFERLQRHELQMAVEALAFQDRTNRLLAGGSTDKERTLIVKWSTDGREYEEIAPSLPGKPVHVAFSPDGEHALFDFDYASLKLWSVEAEDAVGPQFKFSDAVGMPFDLGYDIIKQLNSIEATSDGRLTAKLGAVPVVVRPDSAGASILPAASERPLFSALDRSEARLYPIRGADLLDNSGRWFALATNSAPLQNASFLRVYDLQSGYPITAPLIHQDLGRTGQPWPQVWSRTVSELDPVVALKFSADANRLATLTTNGLLRVWPVLPDSGVMEIWRDAPADLATAVTGSRLLGGGAVLRLGDTDLIAAQDRHRALLEKLEDLRPADDGKAFKSE